MLTTSQEQVRIKADQLWMDVTMRAGSLASFQMKEVVSAVGGGSMPLAEIPSVALAVNPKHISVNQLDEELRRFDPPIFGRITKDQYLLDLRTIQEDEITRVADGLVEVLQKAKQV
jgi:L-seryl-tRNA(Ser) seleniumtransferase